MYFPNFSKKVMLVENTVEFFPFVPGETRRLKAEHGIRDKDIVSLYVGRLERIKGADIIIEHLPRIMRRHGNLKMFIVGKSREPSLYRRLQRIRKDFPGRLFYLKNVEKQLLFQYYYLSDIYVNTSLSESFSLSTHEGALCGNALLLNRLPVFDKFRNAALFFSAQNGNGDGLVHRFSQLIEDKGLRQRLAGKASRLARPCVQRDRLQENLCNILAA
jgi:glycosyltransferase involved in cell wall biosynthesis